jgi:hypothetical protein
MDLRYEGVGTEPDLVLQEALHTSGTTFAVKSQILAWHWADPVDNFERNRNNVIDSMQGNRNPFIDHPELVDYLYGDSTEVAWNPYMNVGEVIPAVASVYPNPASEELIIDVTEHTPFTIFDLTGRVISSGKLAPGKQTISLGCYETGTYVFRARNTVQTLQVIK